MQQDQNPDDSGTITEDKPKNKYKRKGWKKYRGQG